MFLSGSQIGLATSQIAQWLILCCNTQHGQVPLHISVFTQLHVQILDSRHDHRSYRCSSTPLCQHRWDSPCCGQVDSWTPSPLPHVGTCHGTDAMIPFSHHHFALAERTTAQDGGCFVMTESGYSMCYPLSLPNGVF